MYVIFIFVAAGVISPVLFGLSSFLVDVLRSSFAQIDIPSTAVSTLPIQGNTIHITTTFLIGFILAFLIANNFMASTLIGMMNTGRQREGVKYFIPMILLALPLFFLARYAIKSFLGGLFTF